MNFDRYLKLFSALLVINGFYAILITGSYSGAVLAGLIATALAWIFDDRLPSILPIPKFIWNFVAVGFLIFLLYDTFYGAQDLVGNGIKFVVYLQIVKLLSPKTSRDQMQIYLLSFLHILASTVLSSDISFAFPFLTYIVLATWTLALFHLKEVQFAATGTKDRAHALQTLLRSKDIITPRFLGFSSLLSLAIIGFTLIVFFTFPRFTMGQFFKRVTVRQRLSGFSENVELGTIGNIKTSDTISLRVELAADTKLSPEEIDRIFWRGTALDTFDGRKWSKAVTEKERTPVDIESGVLPIGRANFPGGKSFQYRVFLEALSTPILIGADRLYRVTWDKNFAERLLRGSIGLEQDFYNSIYFLNLNNFVGDLTYTGESTIGDPDPEILRKESTNYPYWVKETYLQLPDFHPQVREKLTELTQFPPEMTVYDRVLQIESAFGKQFRYSLEVQDSGTQDPLLFFLVQEKRGHCEYFSSTMIMALRFAGIPAREVVGFRGGQFNPYGRYIAVRQRDAHSWVEVYFPQTGWIPFDPSPSDTTVAPLPGRLVKMYQFIDYLRLRWNKYILEYDLRSQAGILEKIGRQVAKLSRLRPNPKDSSQIETDPNEPTKKPLSPVVKFILVFAAPMLLSVWIWNRRKQKGVKGRYQQIVSLLSKHGHSKELHQTPLEFVGAVEKRKGNLPPFRELTDLYYEERFGAKRVLEARWKRLISDLESKLRG